VDVAGEPAPLVLLRRDDPLGELLVGALPRDEPAVQPGGVQRPGDEPPDRGEQPDVTLGELAAGDRVHVEHPDQAGRVRGHRHRRHRGELLPAQRSDRQVPGVVALRVDEHHRAPVLGDPAGHAGADRQLDAPDLRVERRRRAGQRERAPGVVEDVDEADVGRGRVGDEPGDGRRERLDLRPRRRRLHDREQQRVLPLQVGEPGQPFARKLARRRWFARKLAHRKIPSRSAAATAPARSLTASLR
jgi:hypothetical protein